ncbi:unnamed protein product [Calypogeia fissa]
MVTDGYCQLSSFSSDSKHLLCNVENCHCSENIGEHIGETVRSDEKWIAVQQGEDRHDGEVRFQVSFFCVLKPCSLDAGRRYD